MSLFAERERRATRDAAEAAGQDFWTKRLDDPARQKLSYAVENAYREKGGIAELARRWVLEDLGMSELRGGNRAADDLRASIIYDDEDVVFSVLEAVGVSLLSAAQASSYVSEQEDWRGRHERYVARVKEVLREHRVKYDMIPPRIVPLESQEMHAEIVEPTLRLLTGSPEWSAVERAYLDALEELHNGKPEDAITDAATALQEALDMYGCEGNTVSKKLKDALNKGVFAPHDAKLVAALKNIGEWVEADRSTLGDVHSSGDVEPEDAWLIVHIVGAVILRLSKGPRPGREQS